MACEVNDTVAQKVVRRRFAECLPAYSAPQFRKCLPLPHFRTVRTTLLLPYLSLSSPYPLPILTGTSPECLS
jgi:hypothetical protein